MIIMLTKRTLRKMNLSEDQYIQLWDLSGGRCPLCNKRFNNRIRSRQPCIDHDHKTHRVRGLVCAACNWELGCRHDNERWLEAAARYLRFPPAQQLWTEVPRVSGAPPVKENF